jgi:hypothetical protein
MASARNPLLGPTADHVKVNWMLDGSPAGASVCDHTGMTVASEESERGPCVGFAVPVAVMVGGMWCIRNTASPDGAPEMSQR